MKHPAQVLSAGWVWNVVEVLVESDQSSLEMTTGLVDHLTVDFVVGTDFAVETDFGTVVVPEYDEKRVVGLIVTVGEY